MRLVLAMVLPLALGVAACVAPGAESLEWESPTADEAAAVVPGTPSPAIAERASALVSTVQELMRLNQQWNERLKGDATTPAARREIQETVQKMRDMLAALPAEAEWVTTYVQHHRDEVKAGFASALASDPVRKKLGADKIQKLTDAVNRKGGVDEIILAGSAVVRDHSKDISDMIGQGKKIPMGYALALAVTIAGANAAEDIWPGVVGPMYALLLVGAIH